MKIPRFEWRLSKWCDHRKGMSNCGHCGCWWDLKTGYSGCPDGITYKSLEALPAKYRRVDPRFTKRVYVDSVWIGQEDSCVYLKNVPTGRRTRAKISRFNGKRGGYKYIGIGDAPKEEVKL